MGKDPKGLEKIDSELTGISAQPQDRKFCHVSSPYSSLTSDAYQHGRWSFLTNGEEPWEIERKLVEEGGWHPWMGSIWMMDVTDL